MVECRLIIFMKNIMYRICNLFKNKQQQMLKDFKDKCEKKYYTDVCVICIINEPKLLYVPCGHVCVCNECHCYKIIKCPRNNYLK